MGLNSGRFYWEAPRRRSGNRELEASPEGNAELDWAAEVYVSHQEMGAGLRALRERLTPDPPEDALFGGTCIFK